VCTPAQYRAAYDFIQTALAEDREAVVLVHCAAGRSRSASIVLYYLCRTRGLSLVEGMRRLYAACPIIHTNDRFVVCVAQTLAQDAADDLESPDITTTDSHNDSRQHDALLHNDFRLVRP
jgi:predicted protein tyrosine phosphatase